jgi:hypothetical protein
MIRRDLHPVDGAHEWLLVSQVEHARLSGELAGAWMADDLSPRVCHGQPVARATTDEILAAVGHHDDGWASWEAAPQIDPDHGRPYSFLGEMPLADSLAIWDGSIAAARGIGPLAGWMVAGHFYELLVGSGDAVKEQAAAGWLESKDRQRREWLQTWLAAGRDHSSHVAHRALHLLQVADQLSLWLCRFCPLAAADARSEVEPFVLDWQESGVGPYRFTPGRCASQSSQSADWPALSGWNVVVTPWPFASRELSLTADAWLAPARRYASSAELVNVRRPVKLAWQLTAGR